MKVMKEVEMEMVIMYLLPGLMTSALSNDENTAIMMALGIFYPLLLLSGIVWPIQGIPVALR